MRKYIIWGLLLLCMVQSATAKDKKPVTPKEKQPLAYEAFFKGGMKKIGDVLPLYTDGKKYYLEIGEDVLGTDLLVSGTILTGFWPGTVSEVTDMLRFTLGRNHQLEVVQRNLTDRVDENTEPGLAAAVEQSNMESVKFSYPIHAFGDEGKGYIIDITADVNKSGKIFGFPKLQWVNRPVENRMMVDTICPITNGFKILQSRSQTDITPGGMGMPCRITHNTADIEWTIQRLPKLHMPVREADARVGYNTISYNDYSKDPATVNKTTIIRRWNLEVKKEDEKAYNRGVLVEPANPIRVYLNESFPEEFRQVAEQAVREWDAAFASAGFKNVLQLVDKVEATWEYHQIYCWMGPVLPKDYSVSDPRTGEILSAVVGSSTLDLEKAEGYAKMQLGAFEPQVFKEKNVELRYQIFRRQFSKQLGTALGLTKVSGSGVYTSKELRNGEFVKKNGISNTVMDGALVNHVVQPGDKVAFEDLFGHVSHYDRWALGFGYRAYPGMKAETVKHKQQQWLMKAKGNRLLANMQGRRVYFVNVADQIEMARLGMKNCERLLGFIEKNKERIDVESDTWDEYWMLAQPLADSYFNHVGTLMPYIGGYQREHIIPGFSEHHDWHVSRKDQQAVVKFLVETVFNGIPECLQHTQLRELAGYNGVTTILTAVPKMLDGLTDPAVISVLQTLECKYPEDAYTADELFSELKRAIFYDYSTSKKVDFLQQHLQFAFAKSLMQSYQKTDVQKNVDDLSSFMLVQMREVLQEVKKLGETHSDAATRNHYQGLHLYMDRFLKSPVKEQGKEKK